MALTKRKLAIEFLFLVIILIGSVSAISPSSANISLLCGDYNSLEITGLSGISILNITNSKWSQPSLGVKMAFNFKPLITGDNLIVYFFTKNDDCQPGSTSTTFNIGDIDYTIDIKVEKKEYKLGEKLISINEALKIGQDISFGLLGVGEDYVHYVLKGCQSASEEDTMTDEISRTCSGNVDIKIKILTTIPELDVAKFEVYSSEPGFTLTKGNETIDGDSSECVLGLDTLGAKVKRGNIFAIKSINVNTGKFVDNVAVTILDQSGELSPIAGISSNIGFFSERLHEDYKQNLIVQLEKEGCEPSTQIILFEQSYDDYKKGKQEEEGKYQLVLNMSERYEMKEINSTIKNLLGTGVEGVEVKITRPDGTSFNINTDSSGSFSFTPDMVGNWKLQGGKNDYESTDLISIEIYQNKEYLIITKVDGEPKSEYKKGDRLSFELRDENNTLLPLTIEATFAGQPLQFVNGISDTVTFTGEPSTLNIPATEGYMAQTIQLNKKETKWATILWVIGIIIAVLILIIIIVAIVKKFKGKKNYPGPKFVLPEEQPE